MTLVPWRLAGLLGPLLLVTACGSAGQHGTARLLNDRLQTRLAPDIAAGRAVLQPLPDGARVTLLGSSLFPNTADVLDDRQIEVRATLIEGLLDPALMRLQLADTSTLPDSQRDERLHNMADYFTAFGLSGSLLPAAPLQPVPADTPGATGMTVTIGVVCPDYHTSTGYGSGAAKPACY